MGKIRYYCEYCDRSFIDDLRARKRHLSGTQHHRMRQQYYIPYRNVKEIYDTELSKDPCRKYMTLNMCPFGESCRYSHYSPSDLESLRQQAEMELCSSSTSITNESLNKALNEMPNLDKLGHWLEIWETKKGVSALEPVKPGVPAIPKAWSYDLPSRLKEYRDLPPSLQSWRAFDLQNVHLEDWG